MKIGLLGGHGRMGLEIQKLISEQSNINLVSAPKRGEDFNSLFKSDVIIDFSLPQAGLEWIKLAKEKKHFVPYIVASTGWTAEQLQKLTEYSEYTPVIQSTNFSLGINALHQILSEAAPLLKNLGYEVKVTETHHVHKKDAPSGTALSIESTLEKSGYSNIEIEALREGEVFGDHEIKFFSPSDEIILSHSAKNRDLFAKGALEAAYWLYQKKQVSPVLFGIIPLETFFYERQGAQS
ncbi:MAG: 4-hydroxy-tetrahydrodipicolinate reductase [Bdellovibrionaceae bacterium]|nr:4-hydroxy-tetrahydrodipicolinate reductase [Pseudobdellovibrionaceae bacterium]|tara:strand:- start:5463 stop:6173 length:711 start_codon:yes stop_codon:yes gene_type:complete